MNEESFTQVAISKQDLQQLIHEPSASARAVIASKVSEDFSRSHFTSRESELALDIFRLLVQDTARSVRKAIAENLKDNPHAPHDVIKSLADDTSDIAEMVLEHSVVLTDADLVELIEASPEIRKLLAIAKRESISGNVSGSLISTGHNSVIHTLVSNDNAEIYERDIGHLIETHKNDQSLLDAMVCRGGMSVTYAEKLYSITAERMKKYLTRRQLLSWNIMGDTTDVVRDAAVVGFLARRMDEKELGDLINQMTRNNRLNYSLILRALCAGELQFFEMAMAKNSVIPLVNARLLLCDMGQGFEAFYRSTEMPEGFMDAVRVIYQLAVAQFQRKIVSREEFKVTMVEQIERKGYHQTVENMTYFLSMMRSSLNEQNIA